MTTPASYQTADRLVRVALADAGRLEEGDDPSGELLADGLNRLNDLVNFFQTQGLKLWTLVDQSVTLTASKAKYTFGPGGDVNITKPLRIEQAYFLATSNVRTPLTLMSWDEWLRLSNTTQTGSVTSYFVDKQQSALNLNLWYTPDATAATGTVHVLLQQQITTFVSLTDNFAFPVEWALALRWGLAEDLAVGQPQRIIDHCSKKALMYRNALEDWDVEDAPTMFQADSRVGINGSRFR